MEDTNMVPSLHPETPKKSRSKKVVEAKEVHPDDRMVKGTFFYHESPGGIFRFNSKARKGQKVQKFALVDGQETELPLWVIKHLNKNVRYPVYSELPGEKGFQAGAYAFDPMGSRVAPMKAKKWIPRASFQPSEYFQEAVVDNSQVEIVEV